VQRSAAASPPRLTLTAAASLLSPHLDWEAIGLRVGREGPDCKRHLVRLLAPERIALDSSRPFRLQVWMYIYISIYLSVYIYTNMDIYVTWFDFLLRKGLLWTAAGPSVYRYGYVCMYVYICIYVYVYMYIYEMWIYMLPSSTSCSGKDCSRQQPTPSSTGMDVCVCVCVCISLYIFV